MRMAGASWTAPAKLRYSLNGTNVIYVLEKSRTPRLLDLTTAVLHLFARQGSAQAASGLTVN